MNNRFFMFLIILFFSTSCGKKEISNTNLFNLEDLKPLPSNGSGILLTEFREFIFVKTSDIKTFGFLNSEELNEIYEKYFSKKYNYTSFLNNVLNFKISIPIDYIDGKKIFQLDSIIIEDYEKGGINSIQKKYTKEKNNRFYLNKNIDNDVKIKTILYLFYINKYEYYRDDYSSNEWFEKKEILHFFKNQ